MGCITIITIITALANEDNKNKSHTHSVLKNQGILMWTVEKIKFV